MRIRHYFTVLAVLIIAILAYFIFSNPREYVTGYAVMNPPFYITAWNIKTSEVAIELKNNEKEDYKIQSVSIKSCGEYETPTEIEAGTKITFVINCEQALTEGKTFNSEITILYRKINSDAGLESTGAIAGKVKEE